MNCPEQELLSRYADGETDASETRMADAHLLSCSACAELVGKFREAAENLKASILRSNRRMGCPTATDLFDYLAGDTTDALRGSIEEHLAGCDGCVHDLAAIGAPAPASEAWQETFAGSRPLPAVVERSLTDRPRERAFVPRWFKPVMASAALFLVGMTVGIALFLLPRGEETPREIMLSPMYREGMAQNVTFAYREDGFMTDPSSMRSIPLANAVLEEYDQVILETDGGLPSAVRRSYRQSPSPFFNAGTVTIRKQKNGETHVTSQDSDDFPIVYPYAGPPPAAMEENFAFALPGHAVQIGDRWSANGHALVQFIGKTTHQTLKRIKACSLECRLVSISPSREAVIELGLGYEAEHLSGALVYETRGCFGGTLRFDAAAGRVLHVTLEGRDLAVSAYPNGDPSASPTLNGSASISLDITYR